MHLYLAPLVPEVFQAVCQLHQMAGLPIPTAGKRSITILAKTPQGPQLAGWVGLYECEPFLLAESLIVNPSLPMKVRHQAAEFMAEAFVSMAATGGYYALAFPRSKGLAAILRKYGFQNSGVPMYTAAFPAVQLTAEKKPPAKVGVLAGGMAERKDPDTSKVPEVKTKRKRVAARRT